ncbi:MAG: MATE family efflux transporter [Acidobacteriota bacterium]
MDTGTTSQERETQSYGGFWKSLVESLRGTEQDFTEGSLNRAITLLSVPMVLEMAMESLFGIVDVFFVSSLGPDAVATVGLTESLLTLLFAVAMGLSMATTATVARRIGEKNPRGASVAAAQAILLGLLVSIPTGFVGGWISPWLLGLMGASASVIQTGSGYGSVMLGGNATIILIFLINAVFRGAGDAAIAMRVLWFSNFINIVLDPCLIFGWGPFPELGLLGAAVATNIGRGLGVLYQLTVLFGGQGRVKVNWRDFRPQRSVIGRMARISVGGVVQYLVATASWLGLVRILAVFGSSALAGYTIALRVIIFTILPSWGLSNAAATLVGQNLGAGKPQRAEKSVWMTGLYNVVFLGSVSVVFLVFAESIIRVFTTDAEVLSVGVACLRYVSYGYVFYAYGMVVVQAFNGAGDTTTPTTINLFCYWLLQIPLAFTLAHAAGLGPTGVFLSITVAESMIAVVGVLWFRKGRWKTRVV